MNHTEDKRIALIERLLSHESVEDLVREYPEEAALVRELSDIVGPLRADISSPERSRFEMMLVQARSQKNGGYFSFFPLRHCAAPALLLLLLVGGYGYTTLTPPRDKAVGTEETRTEADTRAAFSAPSAPKAAFMIANESPASGKIFVAGDAMFDRAIRTAGERVGYDAILAPAAPVLSAHEAVVINLEGPVTEASSISEGSAVGSPQNFVFTFAPEALSALARFPVVLHLGNNHILNFGTAGLAETKHHLHAAGLPFFGAPMDGEHKSTLVTTSGGVIAFVSYNEFSPEDERQATIAEIERRVQEGYTTVVYTHWGDEYATTPAPRLRTLAHSFVSAGARLVIGSHPHVVIPREDVGGVPVYYSLGNFVFDQYWMKGVRCGLALSIVVTEGTISAIEELRVSMRRDGTTRVGEEAVGDCAE